MPFLEDRKFRWDLGGNGKGRRPRADTLVTRFQVGDIRHSAQDLYDVEILD
jgi:hypothetical protein